MCTVSYIGDQWSRDFPQRWPQIIPGTDGTGGSLLVGREEFDELKCEVRELKELLKAAKKFDEATGQPDCEMDDKVALIKKIADLVGVDMNEVFPEA